MLEEGGDLAVWLLLGDSIQLHPVGRTFTCLHKVGYRAWLRPHFLGAEHGAIGVHDAKDFRTS